MDERRHLGQLAKGNATREAIIAERHQRSGSRSRMLACPACHERGYSNRAKDDICPQCLYDIWAAQDVAAAAKGGAINEKVVGVRTTRVEHHLPYPSIGFNGNGQVPTGAVFSRQRYNKAQDSPARVMQILFNEIFEGLSEVYPVPPGVPLITFLVADYDSDFQAMVPKLTLTALLDLWAFIEWVTKDAYACGYEEGKDLINGMLSGTLTADAFATTIARQTLAMRERREQAAKIK